MRSVAPLVSGIAGAGLGTANIYKRGTSTLATVYADYAGRVVESNPLSLDANGGVVCYVNEEVDVVVVDSTGLGIRGWTEMGSANNVEYIGQSFTGTDYQSGASGRGKPVSLQTILDLWKTSSGAIDFDVLLNGSSMTLQTAMATVAGLFYNVKAPAYGAVGDNTADDTVAIQAALTAAGNAGGGTVWFPAGTYRITAALSVPQNVSILGSGTGAVLINVDHATNGAFTLSGLSISYNVFRNFKVQAKQSNSGTVIATTSYTSSDLICEHVFIGGSNNTGTLVSQDSSSSRLVFIDCSFTAAADGQQVLAQDTSGTSPSVVFDKCLVFQTAASYTGNLIVATTLWMANCALTSSASSGFLDFVELDGAFNATLSSNQFVGASATVALAAIHLQLADATPVGFSETGTTIKLVGKKYDFGGSDYAASGSTFQLGSRDGSFYQVTSDAASSPTLPALQHGLVVLKRTTSGNQIVNIDAPYSQGMRFTLVVWNKSGGASGTFTPGATCRSASTFSIANDDKYELINFVSKANDIGIIEWVETAARLTNI